MDTPGTPPEGLETPPWDSFEEWRPVTLDGAPWPYEVSDVGRVRRSAGGSNRTFAGRERKAFPTRKGYLRVDLWNDGRAKSIDVHCLVALTFIGPKPARHEVNHIDGDKTNNRSWNLEWVTRGGNIRHAFRKGLAKGLKGERNNAAKLTWQAVDAIRSLSASGVSAAKLASRFGVHNGTVRAVLESRTWKRKPATMAGASALADLDTASAA